MNNHASGHLRRRAMARSAIPLIVLIHAAAPAASATEYSVQLLGLTDADHTLTNNVYHSTVSFSNTIGDATGLSTRPNGVTDAWSYNPATGTVHLIGLTSPTIDPLGSADRTTIVVMSATGDVLGNSIVGSVESAWFYNYNTGTTTSLGRSDPVDGFPQFLNDNGQAITSTSQAEWFFDKTTQTLTPIGLTGALDTSTKLASPLATAFNALGQALGTSEEFNSTTGTDLHVTASWIFNPQTSQTTLLSIPANQTPQGYQSLAHPNINSGSPLNNSGDIAIRVQDVNSASATKFQVMLYNPSSGYLHQAGIVDAAHTGSDGRVTSITYGLNDAGQMCGLSDAYTGTTVSSDDAWFFDKASGATVTIGLITAPYLATGGARVNVPSCHQFCRRCHRTQRHKWQPILLVLRSQDRPIRSYRADWYKLHRLRRTPKISLRIASFCPNHQRQGRRHGRL